LRRLIKRLRSAKSASVERFCFIGILLASLNGALGQIGSATKILLTLIKTSLRKTSHLLHIRSSRAHRVEDVFASRLIVGSSLLLSLTDALQGGKVDAARLSLSALGSVNALSLVALPLLNVRRRHALKGIDIGDACLLRGRQRRYKRFWVS
jgi:hypothetical protein